MGGVPGHRQEQLMPTLIVCLLKTHLFSRSKNWWPKRYKRLTVFLGILFFQIHCSGGSFCGGSFLSVCLCSPCQEDEEKSRLLAHRRATIQISLMEAINQV